MPVLRQAQSLGAIKSDNLHLPILVITMGLFYTVPDKETFLVRKKIVEEQAIPLLEKVGFEKSPFLGTCFGKYDNTLNIYDLCRLTAASLLEIIEIDVHKGDRWIQIYLNILQLNSSVKSLKQLTSVSVINFKLPPANIFRMRLNSDDFKGVPLFNYDFMFRNHKLESYLTGSGYKKSVNKLHNRITADLNNFEKYIKRWHKKFTPFQTTIEGKIIGLTNMTVDQRLELTGLTKQFKEANIKYKEHAKNILTWLEVDESEIKRIIEPS